MARAPMAGSGAAVIGRPMTRMSAPAAQGLRRGHHPALVAQCRACRADARDHDQEVRPGSLAHQGDLMGAADHAVQAAGLGQAPPAARPAPPAGRAGRPSPGPTSSRLVSTVTAISVGAGWMSAIASTRRAHHRLAARGVDVEDGDAQHRDGARRARHGVGDVVEFHVGEHRQADFDDLAHAIGPERA